MKLKYVMLATIAAALGSTANAEIRPGKAPNAGTTVDHYSECFVSNDLSNYVAAPCSATWVIHNDVDGVEAYNMYHDSGRLPADLEAPSEVLTSYFTFPFNGLDCTGREIVTPGGTYRSEYRCR